VIYLSEILIDFNDNWNKDICPHSPSYFINDNFSKYNIDGRKIILSQIPLIWIDTTKNNKVYCIFWGSTECVGRISARNNNKQNKFKKLREEIIQVNQKRQELSFAVKAIR